MSGFTIKSPNENLTGYNASLEFRNGVAYTDDATLAQRFKAKGYAVTSGGTPHAARPPESVEPSGLGRGASSRDAAVEGSDAAGPMSDAFMAPVGAGEGKDPHGAEVVSPGIHATPPAPVVPGEVSADAAAQEAKEQEAAKAVLIDGEPVDTQSGPDWKGDPDKGEAVPAGPLNESDPASEGKGPDAAHRLERPAANASKADWVEFAVENGVAREEAESLSRAGIQARFPEQEA